MIPTYEAMMRPVLECAMNGEVQIGDAVDMVAEKFQLSDQDRELLLPSGKQTKFANRVHWAKTYLKQAGLVEITGRGRFIITERGRQALSSRREINNEFLIQYDQFRNFKSRTRDDEQAPGSDSSLEIAPEPTATPDEALRDAYENISSSLASDLLGRVRKCSPAFFEYLIVQLLLAMGYGGTTENAGRAIGRSGDDGVDGVINQDPLGVDQIYVQAKRYTEGNNIGAAAIREFFGALSLKKAQKGIFVTTSAFSSSAIQTAKDLGMRIVLIDGLDLTKLMLRYNVGCRNEETIYLKKIDEDFFEWDSE